MYTSQKIFPRSFHHVFPYTTALISSLLSPVHSGASRWSLRSACSPTRGGHGRHTETGHFWVPIEALCQHSDIIRMSHLPCRSFLLHVHLTDCISFHHTIYAADSLTADWWHSLTHTGDREERHCDTQQSQEVIGLLQRQDWSSQRHVLSCCQTAQSTHQLALRTNLITFLSLSACTTSSFLCEKIPIVTLLL